MLSAPSHAPGIAAEILPRMARALRFPSTPLRDRRAPCGEDCSGEPGDAAGCVPGPSPSIAQGPVARRQWRAPKFNLQVAICNGRIAIVGKE